MTKFKNLDELKNALQEGFNANEESLGRYGMTFETLLKVYLIESNKPLDQAGCPSGRWYPLENKGWYVNEEKESSNSMFLDASSGRVWKLYSILDAVESDAIVESWIKRNRGLDRCWLTRAHLMHWEKNPKYKLKGIGVRFEDGLASEEMSGNFSLKAWYGERQQMKALLDILDKAKDNFAIHSVRWQKRETDEVSLFSEWYSNGKGTFSKAIDIDQVLFHVSELAHRYEDSLELALRIRDTSLNPFEIDFTHEIDLDAFSNHVLNGQGEMKLWLIETERNPDFRRFRGVDMHTWDRICLDVGPDFAYLTIPRPGCVNAVPRIATIQGEDNAGKTTIFSDGVEIFD